MLSFGNTSIKDMYYGSTKIGSAYLGSTLVYQIAQPPSGYDSYVIHLTWNGIHAFTMAGLHIDGVEPSVSDVTIQYYGWYNWYTLSSSETANAIIWDSGNPYTFNCELININFNYANIPSTVQLKTSQYWGGDRIPVTMTVAGISSGVETELGSVTQTNDSNLIYTVNI